MRKRITQKRMFGVVFLAGLAVLSACSRFMPWLGFVDVPGVLIGYLYSALVTKTGPTGWGHFEARLIAYSSAAIYGLVSVWVGTRESGKHVKETESIR